MPAMYAEGMKSSDAVAQARCYSEITKPIYLVEDLPHVLRRAQDGHYVA